MPYLTFDVHCFAETEFVRRRLTGASRLRSVCDLMCGIGRVMGMGLLFAIVALTFMPVPRGFCADKGLENLKGGQPTSKVHQLTEVKRWEELPSIPTSLAFSPDDSTLVIGMKGQLRFMGLADHALVASVELKSGQVRSLAYSPDGSRLAVGSYQNLSLWDAKTHELIREFKGHRGYVTGVAFSPDGLRLATSCEDELGRVWTVESSEAPVVLKGHNDPVNGIAWSVDGLLITTAAGDETRPTKQGQVRVWDAASGALKHQFQLHQKAATGVAFTQDGRFVLSSSQDEHVNVYDLNQAKALGFFGGHARPTNAVVVHPDKKTAISISGGRAVGKNELFLWEIETGETVATIEGHAAKVTSLAVSHLGRLVATGSQDLTVALWDTAFLASAVIPESVIQNSSPADATIAVAAGDAAAATLVAGKDAKPAGRILRAGIIGLDTSHAEAFTKTLNAETPVAGAVGVRVVAAYPKGSPDIKTSVERVPKYTETVKALGVEIVDSIEELVKRVDVILLETNDGRPHLEQLIPCLKAGKPTFIDKPIAGSLSDAIAIFQLAERYKVPVFSSSSLRFGKNTLAVREGSLGKVLKCETSSPASLEATHPDLFWYGIHGVESLFTVMGTGCESVVRGTTAEGKIEVTGQWTNDRVGIFREGGGYQGTAVGEKGEGPVGSYDGYDPLVFAIVKFFQTGVAPVSPAETLEIYAFMEAADESKRQGGARVTLEWVMTKARTQAEATTATVK